MDYEIMAKGFLKSIKDYGDIQAEQSKLRTGMMMNEFKQKQNFFWKMQEQKAEQQQKLKFIQDYLKQGVGQGGQQGDQGGQGEGVATEENLTNLETPQMRVGTGGEPGVYYPTARDKEYSIKQFHNRIKNKQSRNIPLTEVEERNLERYPMEEEKPETYTEEKRSEIQSAVERIRTGHSNFQAERKNLLTKYPDIGWDTLQNLNDIEKIYKPDIIKANKQSRNTAIQELQKAGYPISENNIKNAIEQLRGQ